MQSIKKTNVKETNIFGKTFARLKQMHYLCIRNQNKCKDETSKLQTTALILKGIGTLNRAQYKRC